MTVRLVVEVVVVVVTPLVTVVVVEKRKNRGSLRLRLLASGSETLDSTWKSRQIGFL